MLNLQMSHTSKLVSIYCFVLLDPHAHHVSHHSSLVLSTFLTIITRWEDICLIRSRKVLGIIQSVLTYIRNRLLVFSSCPCRIITWKTVQQRPFKKKENHSGEERFHILCLFHTILKFLKDEKVHSQKIAAISLHN